MGSEQQESEATMIDGDFQNSEFPDSSSFEAVAGENWRAFALWLGCDITPKLYRMGLIIELIVLTNLQFLGISNSESPSTDASINIQKNTYPAYSMVRRNLRANCETSHGFPPAQFSNLKLTFSNLPKYGSFTEACLATLHDFSRSQWTKSTLKAPSSRTWISRAPRSPAQSN